ncbi:MAG: DedA family protein [Candidatus Dormibacteraeota bacterium]|uniref:DedA family protein n=1 Tax=Candidatus Dormiibacter inghamiae TaxID=3127013 RepID=A0A934ND19_9BACT|nr:DedA family protein [Candidatus Dormibacteraeota bacterium]MBJ7605731.1 DedA family protein [Candidatus Dormibacteraeota bacterium]
MTDFLTQLISKGGLLAILLTMSAESGGIPISSEIVVPLGGYLAGKGVLSFAGVVVAATLGNLIGSLIAFGLTRRYGTIAVLRYGRRLGLHQGHLDVAERFFARFGLAAVFLGRLLPVVRTYISFPAGLSRMGAGPFSLMTVLGALPWNLALAYAGLKLGQHYQLVEQYLRPFVVPLAVLALALLVGFYLYGRRREIPSVPRQ